MGAARLRTLPLSLSGILVGTALANEDGYFSSAIFMLSLLTTVAFQVTSNFANDYGDGTKGTDNDERIGPKRALQSGALSKTELKRGIAIASLISLVLATALIWFAFGIKDFWYLILFLLLALASIWSSIKYTVGKSAYGYKGMGDLFVFLFFGLVAVLGTEFLYTKQIEPISFLPAMAIGFLSVGVLNLNNLRDVVSDEKYGKNTLVVMMGFEKGKYYHAFLLLTSLLTMLIFTLLTNKSVVTAVYMLAFVPILLHLIKTMRTKIPKELDSELKKLALSTFLLSLLLYLSINYFF